MKIYAVVAVLFCGFKVYSSDLAQQNQFTRHASVVDNELEQSAKKARYHALIKHAPKMYEIIDMQCDHVYLHNKKLLASIAVMAFDLRELGDYQLSEEFEALANLYEARLLEFCTIYIENKPDNRSKQNPIQSAQSKTNRKPRTLRPKRIIFENCSN